ncbi:MaoC domain protein dehydratase [Beutenbergia cavernae DSM 12333]|uniref:MaoC domain protein dehydratase n=1 Tax=Beutenbergia cavernae (strain ATCC BAA-8 / DSM 12333 / CCUG 43141 / JCM 11478 / NBRC 16432 / NCIMB 13614 / HKI 0122) TaxID=471853 RepID=C5C0N1_BEUC1|nr:MaoC family dehydratase N-terminal domain-containing protein [Beutenbergia cavernae]ACQ81427.1 MaoC domain protein dehydratase [Beutenbergia cavernae DSM 12333]
MGTSGVDASLVGRVFTATPPFEVDRSAIRAFAGVVGATAPVHHDPTAARAAGFADVVAPVTFAVVIAQGAESEYVADPASGIDFSRVVHAEESFTHVRPIVAGDVLRTAVHVDSVTERGGLALVTTRTEITSGDDAVATVVSTLAVRGAES